MPHCKSEGSLLILKTRLSLTSKYSVMRQGRTEKASRTNVLCSISPKNLELTQSFGLANRYMNLIQL